MRQIETVREKKKPFGKWRFLMNRPSHKRLVFLKMVHPPMSFGRVKVISGMTTSVAPWNV